MGLMMNSHSYWAIPSQHRPTSPITTAASFPLVLASASSFCSSFVIFFLIERSGNQLLEATSMENCLVSDFIRNEVTDWDDEVKTIARFKAFSGQRSDWELRFRFWRDLILKIARNFGFFIIHPLHVKEHWFNRGGLTPLCIDHVLSLMYDEGDIIRSVDLKNPRSGRLSNLFLALRRLTLSTTPPDIMLEDHVILVSLLKDKAAEVVKLLSETHWTSSCIVTLKNFEGLCGGSVEASAVLSHLCSCGKGSYISTNKKEFIEGVKVSLTSAAVSGITSIDCDVLHLISTCEKLQQQLDVIDRHYEISRKSALACLSSGNKKIALRHARELKLATVSREKCSSMLNRVEEVLNVIADVESTMKVSEAMKIGAQAMKENSLTVEGVEICLEEVEEGVSKLKEVEAALGFDPSVTDTMDEDIEEEIKKLEFEIKSNEVSIVGTVLNDAEPEAAELLVERLSNLKLEDGLADDHCPTLDSGTSNRTNESRNNVLEPA